MDSSKLVLDFEVPIEPCFSNHMYRAVSAKSSKRKSGYWAIMARTDGLKSYQYQMSEALKEILPPEKIKNFVLAFSTGAFDVKVESKHYMYYKRFYEMDASNLIKAHEDCIAKHLGIDDSCTVRYEVEKIPTIADNGWLVKTHMELVPRSPLVSTIKRSEGVK